MDVKQKPETITDVTRRIEAAIAQKQSRYQMPTKAKLITLEIRDVERLIHAAIWGDD